MTLIERYHTEKRFADVSEIVTEERVLKQFKSWYIKHAFDAMGDKYKSLYETQYEYLKTLKEQYKRNYDA